MLTIGITHWPTTLDRVYALEAVIRGLDKNFIGLEHTTIICSIIPGPYYFTALEILHRYPNIFILEQKEHLYGGAHIQKLRDINEDLYLLILQDDWLLLRRFDVWKYLPCGLHILRLRWGHEVWGPEHQLIRLKHTELIDIVDNDNTVFAYHDAPHIQKHDFTLPYSNDEDWEWKMNLLVKSTKTKIGIIREDNLWQHIGGISNWKSH